MTDDTRPTHDGRTETESEPTPITDGGSRIVGSASHLDRDLDLESVDARVGERGSLVEAICTGCRLTRTKRTTKVDQEDPDRAVTFKHACHNCKTATWWNTLQVLELEEEGSE